MIEYTLPDFTDGMRYNEPLLAIQQRCPELMLDGVRIGSVYGNFGGCVLNGGRAQLAEVRATPAQIENTLTRLEAYGVQPRLTLTNLAVQECHLADPYVRQIIDAGARHGAAAIVSSPVVEAHLRRAYPSMQLVLSTTREILDVGELNRVVSDFDLVVLNYTKHRDEAFLRAIEKPEKIEVMVNEVCRADCPKRMEHYRRISEDQLSGSLSAFACTQPRTPELLRSLVEHKPGHPVILTNDDVMRFHDELGVCSFKIVGRGMPAWFVADALSYYLIKPAYRASVRSWLLGCPGPSGDVSRLLDML